MKEIVLISGKGGTGKTSLVASFAALSAKAVRADCDVDAADLPLVLTPTVRWREVFRCGQEAVIRPNDCIGCGGCLARCRFEAVRKTEGGAGEAKFTVDATACEGCGVCVWACPVKAIAFPERLSGEWFVSETRYGPMVHAPLTPGGENSGKLVCTVREAARSLAEERRADLIPVDGPPGIGCAVIASVSGASQIVVVTEPTLSGAHDMERVLELARHFAIPSAVCVNKWDLNPEMTAQIEDRARQADPAVTRAQIQGKTAVEWPEARAADDIRAVWEHMT